VAICEDQICFSVSYFARTTSVMLVTLCLLQLSKIGKGKGKGCYTRVRVVTQE